MRFAPGLLALTLLAAPNRGLPARSAASDYEVQGADKGVTVAAEIMDPGQVKGSFSTDLSEYLVIEVAIYPSSGSPVNINSMDFALKADGRTMRPTEPGTVAGVNQRKARSRNNDIALYPSVGMTTGSWGTGVGVGVGMGRGGRGPAPASTDRDRRTMAAELDDKGLQEGNTSAPVAGYLYFPVGKKKAASYELDYQGDVASVKLTLRAKP